LLSASSAIFLKAPRSAALSSLRSALYIDASFPRLILIALLSSTGSGSVAISETVETGGRGGRQKKGGGLTSAILKVDDDNLGQVEALVSYELQLSPCIHLSSLLHGDQHGVVQEEQVDACSGFIGSRIELDKVWIFGDQVTIGNEWDELLRALDGFPECFELSAVEGCEVSYRVALCTTS
jgi:hypothetical protein